MKLTHTDKNRLIRKNLEETSCLHSASQFAAQLCPGLGAHSVRQLVVENVRCMSREGLARIFQRAASFPAGNFDYHDCLLTFLARRDKTESEVA